MDREPSRNAVYVVREFPRKCRLFLPGAVSVIHLLRTKIQLSLYVVRFCRIAREEDHLSSSRDGDHSAERPGNKKKSEVGFTATFVIQEYVTKEVRSAFSQWRQPNSPVFENLVLLTRASVPSSKIYCYNRALKQLNERIARTGTADAKKIPV